jgi:aspartate--ammonia ligase
MTQDKKADLAGPGISTYPEVAKILPTDYEPLLPPKERMRALYMVKDHMEKGMAEALNLQLVQVPLICTRESGVNDYLDRDGSRTPGRVPLRTRHRPRIDAQVVQAATKWKRMALKQFGCAPGEGINTDMRAVRKDYFLDHDHSAYVDQWDWEKVITPEDRNLDYLVDTVKKDLEGHLHGAGSTSCEEFPELATD